MSSPLSRKHVNGFTLLEILMVIAIVGLVLTLTIPAANSLISANRLASAGHLVASLVASARQEAMGSNTMTALVLLARQGTDHDGRAFTILHYDQARGWLQNRPWERLPPGIVVDMDDAASCTFMRESPNPFPFLKNGQSHPPVKYHNAQLRSSGGYAARLFLPGGGLANANFPATIRLVEGRLENGAVIHARPQWETGSQSNQTANYYDVTIIGDTGQTKIDRP